MFSEEGSQWSWTPSEGKPLCQRRQERIRNLLVHQQRVQRIANSGTPALGVHYNFQRLRQVCVAINIGVADPDAAGHYGHSGGLRYVADEIRAAAGNQQIDGLLHLEHLGYQAAVGVGNKLHGSLGHTCSVARLLDNRYQRDVRLQRFRAATQDSRIARLEAEHGDIHRNIWTALVDGADDAQGHPYPPDF